MPRKTTVNVQKPYKMLCIFPISAQVICPRSSRKHQTQTPRLSVLVPWSARARRAFAFVLQLPLLCHGWKHFPPDRPPTTGIFALEKLITKFPHFPSAIELLKIIFQPRNIFIRGIHKQLNRKTTLPRLAGKVNFHSSRIQKCAFLCLPFPLAVSPDCLDGARNGYMDKVSIFCACKVDCALYIKRIHTIPMFGGTLALARSLSPLARSTVTQRSSSRRIAYNDSDDVGTLVSGFWC